MHNTSEKNYTATICAPPHNIYELWVFDNVLHVFFAAFTGFVYFAFAYWLEKSRKIRSRWQDPKNLKWWKAIAAGVSDGASLLVGNAVAAIILHQTPGYQDVPIGELFLLWCSRPSLMFLLFAFGWSLILLEDGKKFESPFARQMLAKILAGFALAEIMTQATGARYLGQTANIGRSRNFYPKDALLPYYLGGPAIRMYAGGLLWTVCSPFLFLSLLFYMVQFIQKLTYEHHEILSQLYKKGPFYNALKKVARESKEIRVENDRIGARRGLRNQRLAERTIRRDDRNRRESERTVRTAARTTREDARQERTEYRTRRAADWNSARTARDQQAEEADRLEEEADQDARGQDQQEEQADRLEERQDSNEDRDDQRDKRQDDLDEEEDKGRETKNRLRVKPRFRFLGRLYGSRSTLGLLDAYSKQAYLHLIRIEAASNAELVRALRRIEDDEAERDEGITDQELKDWATLILRPPEDPHKGTRRSVVYLVLIFGTISYIAQWLFWSGIMETMGPRYVFAMNSSTQGATEGRTD